SSSVPGTAALLALLRFVTPPAAVAQGGGRPFSVLEVGAGATVVAARSTFSGVELGIARRVGAGLTRFALGAARGAYEGRLGGPAGGRTRRPRPGPAAPAGAQRRGPLRRARRRVRGRRGHTRRRVSGAGGGARVGARTAAGVVRGAWARGRRPGRRGVAVASVSGMVALTTRAPVGAPGKLRRASGAGADGGCPRDDRPAVSLAQDPQLGDLPFAQLRVAVGEVQHGIVKPLLL